MGASPLPYPFSLGACTDDGFPLQLQNTIRPLSAWQSLPLMNSFSLVFPSCSYIITHTFVFVNMFYKHFCICCNKKRPPEGGQWMLLLPGLKNPPRVFTQVSNVGFRQSVNVNLYADQFLDFFDELALGLFVHIFRATFLRMQDSVA